MGVKGARPVLIVEDQVILGMELEFALQAAGHHVVGVAVDTRQAFAMAAESRPDLAVVDINLKDGRSGLEIARRMAVEFGIAVLFATAEPELIPQQFAGAYGVVVKPYSAASVQAAVAYCLALRDGFDPGPAPRELLLAPWITAQRKPLGPENGDGLH